MYYYGFNFEVDRSQSFKGRNLQLGRNFAKAMGIYGKTGILEHIAPFTYSRVERMGDIYRSYVPTMKLYRSYFDTAYDLSVFGNQLIFEDVAYNLESAKDVYAKADPSHSSSWPAGAVSVACKRIMDGTMIPELRFYQKGIYYRVAVTPFGETGIDKEQLIEDKFLQPIKQVTVQEWIRSWELWYDLLRSRLTQIISNI